VRSASVPSPHSLEGQILKLYDEHRSELLRYAVWMGVGVSDAEDAVQESFVRLHSHIATGKDCSNLRAWLFRVVHNLAISSSRSAEHASLQLTEDEWGAIRDSASDNTPNPESALLAKEERTLIAMRMTSLSPAQLHCMQLRMEGFRYHQIAEILGVSIPTVATNIRRSVEKMSEKGHE
jgi:RNA polymerase sigma-70 factor (ECF subfamily)